MNTPILLINWRRPERTHQAIEVLRQAKAKTLFVACDGFVPGDQRINDSIRSVRAVLASEIDWPCEVETLFAADNQGCERGVTTAIHWFFANVPEGIVLEDDVLPCRDFFYFAEKSLDIFRHDPKVGLISGCNQSSPFSDTRQTATSSAQCLFSRLAFLWGWATWRRFWCTYRPEITREDLLALRAISPAFPAPVRRYLKTSYGRVRDGRLDSWDYQVQATLLRNRQVAVVPNGNLIRNTGFDDLGATHGNYRKEATSGYRVPPGMDRPEWQVGEHYLAFEQQYSRQHLRRYAMPSYALTYVADLASTWRRRIQRSTGAGG
ncbi:MAG: hypothetical protein NTY17_04770 [Planctomycetia bacterium]|nr:hypothetical protein [Planctomycetia bacterium]